MQHTPECLILAGIQYNQMSVDITLEYDFEYFKVKVFSRGSQKDGWLKLA